MGLSIVKRPQGYINSTTAQTGTYTNASTTITCNSHGLSGGSIIYITSNQAIGFWYVNILDANTFNISEYSGATIYNFVGSGTFTFYASVSTHGWNAVHLPIVYKLTSTLWPTNSVDTSRTVSSYANDNGYVKLTLSGTLTSSVTELEFVKITGASAGIYQILTWYSNSVVTINLVYSGVGMTFGTVQYYYNNYHARIRVYGGLKSTHAYTLQKPSILLTEQKCIPDSNGVITFNINEFLKQQIGILNNNMLLGTLQNNIDAWCNFYITYAEGYDYSAGGYTLLDYVSSYTDDSSTFTGYAVNSDLPFKNTYSGSMSQYIYGGPGYPLKFLTPSLYPELVPNNYFDISFINQVGLSLRMKKEAYKNGSIIYLSFDNIDDKDYGVYRYSVSQSIYLEDRIDLTLQQIYYIIAPSSWTDINPWTSKTATDFNKNGAGSGSGSSESYQSCVVNSGRGMPINITTFFSGSVSLSTSAFLTDDSNVIVSNTLSNSGSGTLSGTLIATSAATRYHIRANYSFGAGYNIIITPNTVGDILNAANISETKTITVNSGYFASGFDPYSNYNVAWLNYDGGFDWKVFTSSADLGVNIEGTKTADKNIFSNWPNSFGEGGDTIKQETIRSTRQTITLRAENLTSDQVQDLFRIKTSPLVQIVNSANDRRTIIPDTGSFVYYKQREKLFNFEFTAEFTDNLSSQSL